MNRPLLRSAAARPADRPGLIAGSVLDSKGAHDSNPFNAEMTLAQYDALQLGAAEQDVVDGLEKDGPSREPCRRSNAALPASLGRRGVQLLVRQRSGRLAPLPLLLRAPPGAKKTLRREARPRPDRPRVRCTVGATTEEAGQRLRFRLRAPAPGPRPHCSAGPFLRRACDPEHAERAPSPSR